MWSVISLLLFLSLTRVFSETDVSKFYCDLVWIGSGYGTYIPSHVVSYTADLSSADSDYIGRVFIKPHWIPGKVSSKSGKITIINPTNSEIQEFSTYEMLTNPNNCVLQWQAVIRQGNFPLYPVPSESIQGPKADLIYLGRAHVTGILHGGKVVADDDVAYVAYEGRIYKKDDYEVLTSQWPKLSARFFNFQFPSLDHRVVEMRGNSLLYGHSEISNVHDFENEDIENNQADWTRNQQVDHNKRIKEHFEIRDNINFLWIQNVTLELDMWFGGDTLEAEINLINSGANSGIIQVTRYRDLSDSISVQMNHKTVRNSNTVHSICSFANVIANFPVEFRAIGEFEAKGLNANQVAAILKLEGRKGIKNLGNSNTKMRAEIDGVIDGRYVYKISSKSRVGNSGVTCAI